MLKMQSMIENVTHIIRKHAPEIFTGVGIAGMITTTIIAVRATPKALELIEDAEYEKNEKASGESAGLTRIEIIKVSWKCYIPATIVGSVSVALLIGANSVHTHRSAALAAACALSDTRLKDYRHKVSEMFGDGKEKEIREEIAKDKLEKNPVSNQEVIVTKNGNTLCYDVMSGRYFKTDIDKLRKVENELNRQMRDEMYISLNEFYYEIGLERIKLGDDLGWNIDDGYIDLNFSSRLADDGTPCLVIDYLCAPRYGYHSLL